MKKDCDGENGVEKMKRMVKIAVLETLLGTRMISVDWESYG